MALLANKRDPVQNQLLLILLPTELIYKIFDFLDFRALLVCKEVGSIFGYTNPLLVSYSVFKGLPFLQSHHF